MQERPVGKFAQPRAPTRVPRPEDNNTPVNDDSTASPQTQSETTPADAEEESQQEQSRTDSAQSLHTEEIEGELQQGNPASVEDSLAFDDVVTLDPETACTQDPRDEVPAHDAEIPNPEATSAEERKQHVQYGVNLALRR